MTVLIGAKGRTNFAQHFDHFLKLENWKKRVGQKNAEDIRNGAAALGQIIHGKLEKYLLGEQLTWGTNYIHKLAHVMTETIINQGFKNVEKIFGLEIALYFYNLYNALIISSK